MSSPTVHLIPLGETVVFSITLCVTSTAIQSDIITAIFHLKPPTKTPKKDQYKINTEKDKPIKTIAAIIGKTIPDEKPYKRAVIYLSGNLIVSIAKTVEQIFESPTRKNSKPIVGLMLGENMGEIRAAQASVQAGGTSTRSPAITQSFMRVAPRCETATCDSSLTSAEVRARRGCGDERGPQQRHRPDARQCVRRQDRGNAGEHPRQRRVDRYRGDRREGIDYQAVTRA